MVSSYGNERHIADRRKTKEKFKMKTFKKLFDKALDFNNMKQSIIEGSHHGKMKRQEVREVVENIDEEVSKLQYMMKFHITTVQPYEQFEIVEGYKKKRRLIVKPKFKYDQMIQYVLLSQFKPIVMNSKYYYAHGSVEDGGPLQTMKAISKWIKNDKSGTRYCAQFDVKSCYPTVDKDILKSMLKSKIKDKDFLIESFKIIDAMPQGLAPGAPISVYLIHFMFQPLDNWILQQDGVVHYVRHMDDIIVFGSNKKKLHQFERNLCKKMKDDYNMEMHYNHQVFPIQWTDKNGKKHGRPLNTCGYLFYRDRTILRKNHIVKAGRKAKKLNKKDKIDHYSAGQMMSELGLFRHCDVHNVFIQRIKPYVNVKKLKHIISKHDKKIAKNNIS